MKVMKKYLKLFLGFIIFVGCSNHELVRSKKDIFVKVYYLPFPIATYVPVTMSNIGTGQPKEIYLTKEEVNDIYEVFQRVSPMPIFTDATVRLKIAIPNKKDIYIEQTGVVLNGEEVQKINIEGLKKLEKIFNIDLNSNQVSELGLLGGTKKKTVVNYYE
jgi:hypothetical protein